MEGKFKDDATIAMHLKAKSGYNSKINGKISAYKWGLINQVLELKEDDRLYLEKDMIDFGAECLVNDSSKMNGTVKDYLKDFIYNKENK